MVQDRLLTALLSSVFENIVSLGTGLILILTSQLIQASTLTVGDFTLFIYYLTYVTRFLNTIGNSRTLHKQTEVSFERLAELMEG